MKLLILTRRSLLALVICLMAGVAAVGVTISSASQAVQTAATPKEQCWIVDYSVEKDVEIDGELYNVYTVLYNGTLKAGEETTVGMTKVYCDTKVDFDNDTQKYTFGGKEIGYDLNNVKIIVTAYGIQAATFENVVDAYNAYNAHTSDLPENAVDID